MPDLPEKMCLTSALHINCDRDAIIVIGGQRGLFFEKAKLLQSVFLLIRQPSSRGETWGWRALSPMSEGRGSPGVLQIGPPGGNDRIQRVLVAGGWRNTAEVLRIDCCDASDCGQWTQIGPLTHELERAFLVILGDRILVFGELMRDFDKI